MNIDLKEIESFIEQNRENILRDIGRLVAVPSIESAPEENAPYGKAADEALELGLKIVEELGLKTRNCEHRIGYAEISGESEKYLATITHVDVVPVGEGWSGDPFIMREREGYIIGRGVMDDKGPSIVCLYALKYLLDKKIPLRYPIRAILGNNEETGMRDVTYYLKNYPAPVFCFSPDSDFPVCNGEKGIYNAKIRASFPAENVISIGGGMAFNVIPDRASAVLKDNGAVLKTTEGITAEREDGVIKIFAKGKGGHASVPAGTINANGVLIDYILDCGLCGEKEKKFFELLQKLHSNPYGKNLGVDSDDGKFTPLTIVGGMLGVEDGKIWQSLDSRFPTTTDGVKITDTIRAQCGDFAEIEMLTNNPPFYIEPNSPEIQTCINTYNEITGEKAELYTMGGGTYARDFPNAVSFGPEHPERSAPEFAGPIHGIDEAACVDYLLEALKIYVVTLLRLEEIDF